MLQYNTESPGTPLAKDQLIPSEFIEGYLQRFLMVQIEALAFGLHKPAEVRNYLSGVAYFVRCSCGLHAEIATNNSYEAFINLSDEEMMKISKEVFN